LLNWATPSIDGDGVNPDGYELTGSNLLSNNFFVTAGYTDVRDQVNFFGSNVQLELKAEYNYRDVDNSLSSLIMGADYEFAQNFSAYADAKFTEDSDKAYSVGVRYAF